MLVDDVLYGADHLVSRWVAKRIPGMSISDGAKALGVVRGTGLVAGVMYERFNGVHCEVSIAAEPGSGWASRSALFKLFAFPFIQLGCHAISVTVPGSNLPSLNLATKLGFKGEAIVAFAAHDGGPLLVLKMFRDECRWISDGQGQQRTGSAGPV
ncbi:MAG: GNAT family N-acetyltransferase [Proteobacteria bacterium]|nr:GNAT family N-acetyltransferase [Pseudomonadota bacterium]